MLKCSFSSVNIYYYHTVPCETNAGEQLFVACKFPFIQNGKLKGGKLHNECAYEEKSNKYWCATQTYPNTNEAIAFKWGYCNNVCPKEQLATDATTFRNGSNIKDGKK